MQVLRLIQRLKRFDIQLVVINGDGDLVGQRGKQFDIILVKIIWPGALNIQRADDLARPLSVAGPFQSAYRAGRGC